jgi:hypothetical protein
MGSSRSISSHCDPKTLAAIDLAFEGAWNVLKTATSLCASRTFVSCKQSSVSGWWFLPRTA